MAEERAKFSKRPWLDEMGHRTEEYPDKHEAKHIRNASFFKDSRQVMPPEYENPNENDDNRCWHTPGYEYNNTKVQVSAGNNPLGTLTLIQPLFPLGIHHIRIFFDVLIKIIG